jgi:hypothetical protein
MVVPSFRAMFGTMFGSIDIGLLQADRKKLANLGQTREKFIADLASSTA